ncbi:MAG TPA: pantothenate permease [Acidobacteria bacterium]|nr:pantothenate permease [Acidobacteriota bacterium]
MPAWVTVFLVTVGYLALSLAVGLFSGRKASTGTEGYVAGDRDLGFFVLYFVLGASIFSAFSFLGGPGWAYSRGAAAFYIISYTSLGLVPMYFFGPRVAQLGRRFGYVTQAQLFAHRYHSRYISLILAVISLTAFVPYLTLQMQGAGYVFSVVTEGRMPVWAGAAVTYGVVLLYVFRSGVMGVAWTNTFQGILMMSLAWGLGLYLPYALHGGIGPMFARLVETSPAMLAAPGLDAAGAPWTWGGYSSAIAISVFGFSVWPHYFMKIYTANSIATLRKTVVFYPTFAFFLLPILLIGFSGILIFPNVTPVDTILPTIVTSLDLPAVIVGLFCAGALAASMSSGDAIVHAAGAVAIKDGYRVLAPQVMDDGDETRLIRWAVVIIGAVSYYVAIYSNISLVLLLLLSYGFIAQIFPALIASLYWRRSTPPGVIAGLVAGCLTTVVWNLIPVLQWQQIHPGIWGLAANTSILLGVSLATRPMDPTHVADFIPV